MNKFKISPVFAAKLLNGEANLVGGKLLLDSIKISIVGGKVRLTLMTKGIDVMHLDAEAYVDRGDTVTVTGLTIIGEITAAWERAEENPERPSPLWKWLE